MISLRLRFIMRLHNLLIVFVKGFFRYLLFDGELVEVNHCVLIDTVTILIMYKVSLTFQVSFFLLLDALIKCMQSIWA